MIGSGNNRFALRVTGAQRGAVSIAGFQAMSIYANYTGANTTFNLVRVIPAAATKTLNIGFFDVGDATTAGTVQVLPADSTPTWAASLASCTGRRRGDGHDHQLQADQRQQRHRAGTGKYENIKIPIPSSYTCTYAQAGGCWWRLVVNVPGRRHRHHHLDGQHRRRPDPADQVGVRPSGGRCPAG